MSPLAGNRVRPADDLSVDHDPTADPGAENHPEYHRRSLRRSIDRFGQGEAIRVVLQPDRPAERRFEVLRQRLADEPGGVGVLDQPGGARLGSWDADTDAALPDLAHQGLHSRNRRPVVAARRGDALAKDLAARCIERQRFYFRAAEVNAYP